MKDLKKSYLGLKLIATAPALLIKERLTFLCEHGPKDFEHLEKVHSAGAIHLRLALLMMKPEHRNRITVVAIAPAAYIKNDLCKKAYNYVSRKDFVHHLQHLCSPISTKDVNLIVLDAHPQASKVFDHAVLSPTFKIHIKNHIDRFIEE